MLTSVAIRSNQGALLTLPLQDVSSGLVLKEVEGLNPVKATIVSSSYAALDGTMYQSSRREGRNIVLHLDLEPDYILDSVSDLRARLYNFFMPKSEVKLTFYTSEGLNVDILGRVESLDTPLFTRDPAVDISIVCFDPDLADPDVVIVTGNTVSTTTRQLIHYEGTVETGIKFILNVNRAMTAFTIYHNPPDGTNRQLDFQGALAAGDILTISTLQGAKSVILNHAGVSSSVLYGMLPTSNWIELMPGDNYIRVYATGAAVPYSIQYNAKYGGL